MISIHRCAALSAALFGTATVATAQEATSVAETHEDWFVFEAAGPQRCWISSRPEKSTATRNNAAVDVRRGDISLYVSFFPEEDASGQVSFASGYPFEPDSTVDLNVDGAVFALFTRDEGAWTESEDDDARIVAEMKRGAEAVVTGLSSRGTTTKDTFSLIGFSAALEDAERRCSG